VGGGRTKYTDNGSMLSMEQSQQEYPSSSKNSLEKGLGINAPWGALKVSELRTEVRGGSRTRMRKRSYKTGFTILRRERKLNPRSTVGS